MAKYVPRLTAPSTKDKNWLHYENGGYNYCIEIDNGSCLPNCVGYAWGRWRELLGKYHNLSRGNAENWWGNNDGYERGQTPRLGAVICWAKGEAYNSSDGAGHVAIVEKINSDGSIVISNSGYRSTRFWTETIKPPYKYGSAYNFQGFIYIPLTFDKVIDEGVKTVTIELNVLKRGATGEQVKTLQRLLLALGYDLKQYGVDGSFGGVTENAVEAFQKNNGLDVDGIVGPQTWNKLLK